jgi:hypothetical protein
LRSFAVARQPGNPFGSDARHAWKALRKDPENPPGNPPPGAPVGRAVGKLVGRAVGKPPGRAPGKVTPCFLRHWAKAERSPAAPNAGRDAAGVGVVAPLAPPQPATKAPASSTGPNLRSRAVRQKTLLNDVSL